MKDIANAPALRTGVMQEMTFPVDRADDYFGITFSGFFQAPQTGVYAFYLTSDDGSQLFVHDTSLILNDGMHSTTTRKAQIALEKGMHPITVYFFEASGGEFFQMDFSGPGYTKQPIPMHLLFHK